MRETQSSHEVNRDVIIVVRNAFIDALLVHAGRRLLERLIIVQAYKSLLLDLAGALCLARTSHLGLRDFELTSLDAS